MGIKGQANADKPQDEPKAFVAPPSTAKLFADQEEQYERARAFTHTQRGLGLGFSSAPAGPPGNLNAGSSAGPVAGPDTMHERRPPNMSNLSSILKK